MRLATPSVVFLLIGVEVQAGRNGGPGHVDLLL